MPNANINIRLTSNAQEVVFKLEKFPETMGQPIAQAMDLANQHTLGIAEKERLSFPKSGPPTPLGLRTISGNLRRNGRAEKSVVNGLVVSSAIFNPVPYAKVHEFGFSGTVQVAAFTRNNPVKAGPRGGRGKKGNNGTSLVRAHSRLVNLPARQMYTLSIEENVADYSEGISSAITAAWEGQS